MLVRAMLRVYLLARRIIQSTHRPLPCSALLHPFPLFLSFTIYSLLSFYIAIDTRITL
jgi:hypothetical protein